MRQAPTDSTVVAALEALRVNRPLRAEEICREYLNLHPGSLDHLRLLGHALTKQERHPEAERTIRLALALRPDVPHLHEDLGSVLALQQRFAEAVPCFEQAIRLEPRLPLAHKKLGEALAALGRGSEADEAFEEFFAQSPQQGRVALAMDHMRAGRKSEAIETLQAALREHPDNVDALHALATIYVTQEDKLTDAEALVRRAVQLAPALAPAWLMLGTLLHDSGRHAEAVECFRKVTAAEPANPAAWGSLGHALAQAGDVDGSIAAYHRALELNAEVPGHYMGLGHVLKTSGDQPGSLRAYRAAIERKPDFGEVYWSMANLKTFRFEPADVEAMKRALEQPDLNDVAEIHFRFALAKAHEDADDYDAAWHYYDTGNQRQRQKVFHDPAAFEMRHDEIMEVFSTDFLARHAGAGYESAAPIFIVGLPRSGSTLIEQILASHSQVEGTAELATLGQIADSIGRYHPQRLQYPQTLRDVRGKELRAYGKQYLDETLAFRTTDRPHFTDKLPNNFSYVGFIHLILPNAKIINARRHPLDSCLGAYKQLFGKGQNFTYDVTDLAWYYRKYHETMQHWHRVLPGKVLDVHYEETVADLESQVRRILAHCGLEFEAGCLRFHETRRAVKTASSEQVRQPLYSGALGFWRRYEKHLSVWQESLADIIEGLPERVRNAGL